MHVEASIESPVTVPADIATRLAAHEAYRQAVKHREASERKLQRTLYQAITDHLRAERGNNGALQLPRGFTSAFPARQVLTQKQITAVLGPIPTPVPSPPAPAVRLTIKLTNRNAEPLLVDRSVTSDVTHIELTITGPGAYRYDPGPVITTREFRSGAPVTLAPGESLVLRSERLNDGRRLLSGPWYLRKPGRHELAVRYVSRRPGKGRAAPVSGRSEPVPFEVRIAPDPER